jgi:hypothetical protein
VDFSGKIRDRSISTAASLSAARSREFVRNACSQVKNADHANDNEVDRDDKVKEARHDENENAGDQRNEW